METKLSV